MFAFKRVSVPIISLLMLTCNTLRSRPCRQSVHRWGRRICPSRICSSLICRRGNSQPLRRFGTVFYVSVLLVMKAVLLRQCTYSKLMAPKIIPKLVDIAIAYLVNWVSKSNSLSINSKTFFSNRFLVFPFQIFMPKHFSSSDFWHLIIVT